MSWPASVADTAKFVGPSRAGTGAWPPVKSAVPVTPTSLSPWCIALAWPRLRCGLADRHGRSPPAAPDRGRRHARGRLYRRRSAHRHPRIIRRWVSANLHRAGWRIETGSSPVRSSGEAANRSGFGARQARAVRATAWRVTAPWLPLISAASDATDAPPASNCVMARCAAAAGLVKLPVTCACRSMPCQEISARGCIAGAKLSPTSHPAWRPGISTAPFARHAQSGPACAETWARSAVFGPSTLIIDGECAQGGQFCGRRDQAALRFAGADMRGDGAVG